MRVGSSQYEVPELCTASKGVPRVVESGEREGEMGQRRTADEVVQASEEAVLPVNGDGAESVGREEARDALVWCVGQGDAVVESAEEEGAWCGRGEARAGAGACDEGGAAE